MLQLHTSNQSPFIHQLGISVISVPPRGRACAGLPGDWRIAACDPASSVGRRDRAILLLLAVYGLRCGEVVALTVGSIEYGRGMGARTVLGYELNPKDADEGPG